MQNENLPDPADGSNHVQYFRALDARKHDKVGNLRYARTLVTMYYEGFEAINWLRAIDNLIIEQEKVEYKNAV